MFVGWLNACECSLFKDSLQQPSYSWRCNGHLFEIRLELPTRPNAFRLTGRHTKGKCLNLEPDLSDREAMATVYSAFEQSSAIASPTLGQALSITSRQHGSLMYATDGLVLTTPDVRPRQAMLTSSPRTNYYTTRTWPGHSLPMCEIERQLLREIASTVVVRQWSRGPRYIGSRTGPDQ